MAYRKFNQIRIAGVAAAVPEQIRKNSDILGDIHDVNKTAKLVGIESRHVTPQDVCTSDLCFAAAENLLHNIGWERNSIDVLIFLSQTPDYIVPATSCVLQSRLNLSNHCAAFDMNLGCSGYIYGLLTAFGLIDKSGIKRVLMLVGDTPSKLISPYDVPANILFGDAGTATAVEFHSEAGESFISVGTDGIASDALIITAGGFRNPKSSESSVRKPHPKDNVLRSDEELYMDGSAVFGLTLTHVPTLVDTLIANSGWGSNDIDCWLFHQANKFMLDYFAKKIGIPTEKMLMNIHQFGNTSPPSIPLLMVTENLRDRCMRKSVKLGLIGFGVGFSWGGAFVDAKDIFTSPLIYY